MIWSFHFISFHFISNHIISIYLKISKNITLILLYRIIYISFHLDLNRNPWFYFQPSQPDWISISQKQTEMKCQRGAKLAQTAERAQFLRLCARAFGSKAFTAEITSLKPRRKSTRSWASLQFFNLPGTDANQLLGLTSFAPVRSMKSFRRVANST